MTLLAAPDRPRARRPAARHLVRTASRVHAALTVLAFVVSSLIGVVHEARTMHVRCAQHGELMHGDAAATTAAARPGHAMAAARATEHEAARDRQAPITHGHEHCSLVSATRESRLVPRCPAIAATPIAVARLTAEARRAVAARADDVYRTAPKTSPPA